MIRAKLKCIENDAHETYESVTLVAIYEDGGNENASFAEATPSASLQMTISNPAAFGEFVAGKCYYLDFTPVAEAPTGDQPTANAAATADQSTTAGAASPAPENTQSTPAPDTNTEAPVPESTATPVDQ